MPQAGERASKVGPVLERLSQALDSGRTEEALRLLPKTYPIPRKWTPAVVANAQPAWSEANRCLRVMRNGLLYAGGRDWFTQCDGRLNVLDQVNANPAGGQYVLRLSRSHTALRAPRVTQRLPDRPVALLGSSGNYYHWLLDYLPRLPLLAGLNAPLVVGETLAPFERASLRAMGIAEDHLLPLGRHVVTGFRRLYVPDLGSFERRPHRQTIQWLRQTFSGKVGPWRRLWISRRDAASRRLVNEARILEALAPLGFRSVEMAALTIPQQAELFAGAEIIAGPHGAGFTNMVFCRSAATMIEIVPAGYQPVFFESLADVVGAGYMRLEARLHPTDRQRLTMHPRDWDMMADPAQIVAAIRGLQES